MLELYVDGGYYDYYEYYYYYDWMILLLRMKMIYYYEQLYSRTFVKGYDCDSDSDMDDTMRGRKMDQV